MKATTYRNAAEKILRNRLDPKRLKRADKLLAKATKCAGLRGYSHRSDLGG